MYMFHGDAEVLQRGDVIDESTVLALDGIDGCGEC